MTLITLYADETDPDTRLAWKDATGALRNFTGWTMSVEVVDPATNAVRLAKSSGVTGSDGSGLSNVNIAWTAAELTGLAGPASYWLRVLAVNGSERAVFTLNLLGTLPRLRVILKPT